MENRNKWIEKKKKLESSGIKVELMRECEWRVMVKTPQVNSLPTRMSRILLDDTEDTLLEAIRNDNDFVLTGNDEIEKHFLSRYTKSFHQVHGEDGDIACYTLTQRKKNVKDQKPVHVGCTILQWSKLLFLR